MTLSFFQALNPVSKKSGISYPSYAPDKNLLGQEIIDKTVLEQFRKSSGNKWPSKIGDVFQFIIGSHYSFGYGVGLTSKGALDFLIFPLVSRVLLNEFEHKNVFNAILAWSAALPLEIIRFSLAISLTLLIAPIVALIDLIKCCLPKQEQTAAPSSAS